MEVHGITFTHDSPDWDYCKWECACGAFSGVSQINLSFDLAAMHVESTRKRPNGVQVQAR